MITDDELNSYRKPNGDLPGTGRLMATVQARHPDWDFFRVCEYGRRLYAADADRIRAETDAIRAHTDAIWAEVDQLHVKRRQLEPEPRKPEPRATGNAPGNQYDAISRRYKHISPEGLYCCQPGREPSVFWLLPTSTRIRQQHQNRRIRERWTQHVKAYGFPCRVCGETFRPRNGEQKRCRTCIGAGKRKDGT